MNDDDRLENTLPSRQDAHAAPSLWAARSGGWERAIETARGGDLDALVNLISERAKCPPALVQGAFAGSADETVAILCRAAALSWDSFEAVLLLRSRQHGRGPGAVGRAIRLFRDTTVEAARAQVRATA